jgi:preprotein translocase subunit YajC
MHLIDLNGMLAQATAPQTASPPSPQGLSALFSSPLPMLVLFGVMMYFLLFRPQQQQRARLAKLISSLKSGDKVVAASGIVGVVISVKDKAAPPSITIRTADAKMEVTKSSVTEILEGGDAVES